MDLSAGGGGGYRRRNKVYQILTLLTFEIFERAKHDGVSFPN